MKLLSVLLSVRLLSVMGVIGAVLTSPVKAETFSNTQKALVEKSKISRFPIPDAPANPLRQSPGQSSSIDLLLKDTAPRHEVSPLGLPLLR